MTFGENLINLRKQHKMTQEEVAEKLEITRQTISNWELNQTKPDLDQLMRLSKLYKISLDKLANNNIKGFKYEQDSDSKNIETIFLKLKSIILNNIGVSIMIFTLLCIIAIGVCVIVDYAINNKITWGAISIPSIIFGYIVLIPLCAKKHRILLFLCTITIVILPFLYILEKAIPSNNWFESMSLPITIVSLVGVWITYIICRFFKKNKWYMSAILILMWAAIISPIINHITDEIAYISFQNFTNVFSSLVLAIVCIICGYIKAKKMKN